MHIRALAWVSQSVRVAWGQRSEELQQSKQSYASGSAGFQPASADNMRANISHGISIRGHFIILFLKTC